MTLPELAVRRPITTSMVLVTFLVIGAIAIFKLPLAFMPDVEDREIYVIANYPDASPQAIERMIVRPLEDALSSMPGLTQLWSRCDGEGARVNLTFSWNVDMDIARTEIRERLDRARDELPEDMDRILISPNWNARVSGESILEARISSGRDLSHNYPLLERKIIKPLERLPGVASVSLDGVNPREVKVNLSLSALKAHQLTARDVYRGLLANNADRSLGVLRNEAFKYTLRAHGSFDSLETIKSLPIAGTQLRLRDIAEISYEEPPLEYGRHLEGKFAVGLNISKESSANTVEVCAAVRDALEKMGDDPELQGIEFLVWEDQGKEITHTINDLKQTGLIGAFLAALVLYLFLKRFSTTVVAVACIPFSLITACGVIWFQGSTLNTISLMGLIVGIGMLVDNAVVVIENIDRYQKMGLKSRIATLLGAREVSVAVIAATLTSIIVFLPLMFNKPNEMNLMLRELAFTVCITLAASLFISQTLIPLTASKFVSTHRTRAKGPWMHATENVYVRILNFTLNHRWIAPVVGLAVLASVYFPATQIDWNFESNRSEMFVGMDYRFSENLPLDEKERIVSEVEKALAVHKKDLHVGSIYSWWSDRWSLTRLYMEDGYTTEEHMNAVRKALPDILPKVAGVKLQVQDNGKPWKRNDGKRIGFQLRGPDSEELARIAEEAKEILASIPDLFDAYAALDGDTYEMHAVVDRDRAHALGVDLRSPAELVELTFRGRRLPRFKGPEGEVEMRLTLDDRDTHSLEDLRGLSLTNQVGSRLPLESITDFNETKAPAQIQRSGKITSTWVGARYDTGKKEEHIQTAQEALSKMDLPYGYSFDFNSFRRERQESMQDFWINLLLSLLLIFAVMAGLFESVSQALSLMVSLPFALSGAFWTLYGTGTDFDSPAMVGLLLLLGIVVNNGIVMVEHINQYRRKGFSRREAMLRGGRERLRPILMTVATTLMSLVPIVIQKPALAGVYYYSMAFVIMGGLALSTVLTTLFLPTTVCIIEDFISWVYRKSKWVLRLWAGIQEPFLTNTDQSA
ncbi:MAG: efflux RND transporter permease subunit [Acidobacteria bacterium]|nr:efflux RND transporter permease subunit [Acidobacteriota bacterium]